MFFKLFFSKFHFTLGWLSLPSRYMSLSQSLGNEGLGSGGQITHALQRFQVFLLLPFLFCDLRGCRPRYLPTHPVCAGLGLGGTLPPSVPTVFPQPLLPLTVVPALGSLLRSADPGSDGLSGPLEASSLALGAVPRRTCT